MSRSDEEGFHPHPGDPWHPGWVGEDDDDVDPFAAAPEKPDAGRRPKKRGRFGRRKGGAGARGPRRLRSRRRRSARAFRVGGLRRRAGRRRPRIGRCRTTGPSWTDEGGSSVEFESAFTVGGDVGSDDADLDDILGEPSTAPEPAAPRPGPAIRPRMPAEIGLDLGFDTPDPEASGRGELDLSMLGLTDEPPVPAEEPTLLLDEVVLPDLPDLSRHWPIRQRARCPDGMTTTRDDESIPHLDDLLSRIGEPDDAADDSGRRDHRDPRGVRCRRPDQSSRGCRRRPPQPGLRSAHRAGAGDDGR